MSDSDEAELRRKCDEARRDRDVAADQIAVITNEQNRLDQVAKEAEYNRDRAEGHVQHAANAQHEAESELRSLRQRIATAEGEVVRLTGEFRRAEREYEEAKNAVQIIGYDLARATDALNDARSALAAAKDHLEHLLVRVPVQEAEVERCRALVREHQEEISRHGNAAIRARAEHGALAEERHRRRSEYADAEARMNQYCR
ncbi:MAG TPA: hypothetical protein DCR14_07805 [Acidimicrobiaceae bacterium]|nr:hypothetical protein [Acidimicrobiaceae bacterium]